MLDTIEESSQTWVEYRPRPERLSAWSMLKRMFYNPTRNETLFIASCAERLIKNEQQYGAHSVCEIFTRIEQDIVASLLKQEQQYLQFRLAFISRQKHGLEKHILFVSEIKKLERKDAAAL
ncbi:MAG: hypothetical protein ABJO86_05155 [Lentilitoribacter sp.]